MAEPLLSAETLMDMRQLNEDNLPHLADVYRQIERGPRVGGALIDASPALVFESLACRLSVSGGGANFTEQGAQESARGRWTLTIAERDLELPEHATAVVSGLHADRTPWTRAVRIVSTRQTRALTCMQKYDVIDLGIPGAP